MSNISSVVLDIQEIVDPMAYMGIDDEQIIEEVRKFYPDIPVDWIRNVISSARFNYNQPDSYS